MSKRYIIYGRHSVKSVLQNPNRKIDKILCTKSTIQFVENEWPNSDYDRVEIVERLVIEKVLQSNSYTNALHQDVIVFTQKLKQPDLYDIFDSARFLVLMDELQDSQNIGTIMRSAALFNVDAVVTTEHNSPEENPQMVKSASGAFEYMPFIRVTNLARTVDVLKKHNFWVIGMSCHTDKTLSEVVGKMSRDDKIALIVGSEESGMRKMVEKNCDFLCQIPVNQKRGVDSLNASAAAGICMYEVSKVIR